MTERLDAGPVVRQWTVPLTGREETPDLEAALGLLAAERIPGELEAWSRDALEPVPQDDGAATYQPAFSRRDGWIDWRRGADEIDRQVRALQPWPGAWTTVDGRRLHVRRAHPEPGAAGPAHRFAAAR